MNIQQVEIIRKDGTRITDRLLRKGKSVLVLETCGPTPKKSVRRIAVNRSVEYSHW